MNGCEFELVGQQLIALASGALLQPGAGVLCVSDLHLGKSDRIARRTGSLLPPYENIETLGRLADVIDATGARTIICLGDSFDDLDGIDALDPDCQDLLTRCQAGRRWIWIEGNHDPGPVGLGGTHRTAFTIDGLTYRHIADPGAEAEISGHYHPKMRIPGGGGARKCLVYDRFRCILPPFGTYTGGLNVSDPAIASLLSAPAFAVLTGRKAIRAPVPLAHTKRVKAS